MNIEEKYKQLKQEIDALRTNVETLTRVKIHKQVIFDRRQNQYINNSGLLEEAKENIYKQKKHKISVIDNWSIVFKFTSAIVFFILIYPQALTNVLQIIETTANLSKTLLTTIGFSALLTGSIALSFKIINTVAKKKIEKIKSAPEYKELEEKLKVKEKIYEDSIKLLEVAKEEYLEAKLEYEKQNKLLAEKELILSWLEKTIINCDELSLEEDKSAEKPRAKIREIKQ